MSGRRIVGWLDRALPAPVTRALSRVLPAGVKSSIRDVAQSRWLTGVERVLAGRSAKRVKADRGSVARATLRADLERLPIRDGSIVFVHSSLSAIGYVDGGPATVVDELVDLVVGRRHGTLAFPTFSITGTMADSLRSGQTFDARTSPSAVGAITDVFRQRPGVLRSLHPTHSVAALGPRARWLTEAHHRCGSTFGPGSPLGRLLEGEGDLLGLGVSLGPVTFYHVLEDHRPDFPLNVYTSDSPLTAVCRDPGGTEHRVAVMAHDSDVAATRIDRPAGEFIRGYVTRQLERHAGLRWFDVGRARAWMVGTPAMYRALEALMEARITIYSTRDDVLARDPRAAAEVR